ncbi:MAG: ABC transporter ATP-binding protein [Anaerolineales bacterium]|nr:ABC transporter ATP-binding protein [Anaerolineales bacterium]
MQTDVRQMLKLSHVDTHYGPIQVLRDVNVEINVGEITCLLGGNASGKSTTLRTIIGMVKPTSGTIEFDGERIDGLNIQQLVERGISMVPENRRIFGRMTVQENLEMGAFLRKDRSGIRADMERVFGLFPRLKERIGQLGGTMSGGEQQMLAMARALMSRPSLLLMDEPSMGLSPLFVQQTFDIIQEISRQGTTIFMVEQNANMALSIADRGYVLQTGKIVLADTASNLRENKMMRQAYLGET